jgi:hypothetical protein
MEGQTTLYVYGDPAYKAGFGTACPFTSAQGRHFLPQDQQEWNRKLSSVRIAIEQSFGRVQVLWTYTAFGKGLRAGWQPVATYFVVAVLLSNCHTCLRSNNLTQRNRFMVLPPEVEAYLV